MVPTLAPNGPVYPDGVAAAGGARLHAAPLRCRGEDAGDRFRAAWRRSRRRPGRPQAGPGKFLGVGGPRGSFIVPDDFDWYLLAGDETALPAIGRRLEELPAGTRALVVIEVADAGEEQRFETRTRLDAALAPSRRRRAAANIAAD